MSKMRRVFRKSSKAVPPQSGKVSTASGLSEEELNKQFGKLVSELRVKPEVAAQMMKMDRAQKLQMIEAQAVRNQVKVEESGKNWAKKFANKSDVSIKTLQEFIVVLKDSKEGFVSEFISELGLSHLCRIGLNHFDIAYDLQLMLIFKGMIDTAGTVVNLINHDYAVRLIVQKIDSEDPQVRELAVHLLLTLVAMDSDYVDKAVNDILHELSTQAGKFYFTRNHWKPLLSHLNVSARYDGLCVTLINYLLGSLTSVESRIEERRLLNCDQYDAALRQMDEELHARGDDRGSITQIEAYFALLKEDHAVTNDLNDPALLFARLQTQCLEDGFINQLASILNNLVTLPSTATQAWHNISRVVGTACQPIQKKLLAASGQDTDQSHDARGSRLLRKIASSVKASSATGSSRKFDYPSYEQLELLLSVRDSVDEKERDASKEARDELERARNKILQLEGEMNKLRADYEALQKNGGGEGSGSAGMKRGNIGNIGNAGMSSAAEALAASLQKRNGGDASTAGASVGKNDGLDKYRKMLKMKLPKQSVINKMMQDKVDKSVIEAFERTGNLPGGNGVAAGAAGTGGEAGSASTSSATATSGGAGAAVTLTAEEEAKVAKYKKMLKLKMPQQSVINKMRQDKIEESLIAKMFPSVAGTAVAAKVKKAEPELPPNLKPKRVIKPHVKMRNLHWQKVNPFDVENTLWNEINDDSIKLDTKSLETQFCTKETKVTITGKGGVGGAQKRKNDGETVSVLEGKRSYNVEIFLGRIKMDNWVIREAMVSMDEKKLDTEVIGKLINFVPTPAEAQLLDGYEDEPNLGKAETFFKVVRTVDKNLKQRLELWKFKIEFGDIVAAQYTKIVTLRQGAQAIDNSAHLKQILAIILAVGNYMNGSTKKGQAYGFRIISLNQLVRSRSVDNSKTLLEYLYEFLLQNKQYKKCLNFVSDLAVLDAACQIDLPQLRKDMAQIGVKLNMIKSRLQAEAQAQKSSKNDRFVAVMEPFYSKAVKEFENVKTLQTSVTNKLKQVGTSLNESKDINCEYFRTINSFKKDFVETQKLHALKLERQEKERIRKERRAKKVGSTGSGVGTGKDGNGGNGGSVTVALKPGKLNLPQKDSSENSSGSMEPSHTWKRQKSLTDLIVQGLQSSTNSKEFLDKLAKRRSASKNLKNKGK